jgi:2-dehydropantoate 2-reductase
MKIVIFGAGGVGSFYGALLARAGQDVHFIARGAQLDVLRSKGLRIKSATLGTVDVHPVQAVARAGDVGQADLILLCVKAYHVESILDDVASIAHERTIVVGLQNGVETDELLAARLGRARVLTGILYVGATLEEPGVVSHLVGGRIVVGARAGADAGLLAGVRETLSVTGLPVQVATDIERERWYKLIWNAAFNPLTALTSWSAHELLAEASTRELLVSIMDEVVQVARKLGIDLRESDVDAVMDYTRNAPSILTSMEVDRRMGRPLETEALIGVVVRNGRQLGIPTPVSSVVYTLLTAIDRRSRSRTAATRP